MSEIWREPNVRYWRNFDIAGRAADISVADAPSGWRGASWIAEGERWESWRLACRALVAIASDSSQTRVLGAYAQAVSDTK